MKEFCIECITCKNANYVTSKSFCGCGSETGCKYEKKANGHGRLIDADRLKGIIRKANEDCMFVGKYERAKQWSDAEFYVDHAPTVLEVSNGRTD